MESGEIQPAGESEPGPYDALPGIVEGRGFVLLVVPAVYGVAAWAVDRYTRSVLGGWRYIPVVFLGAGAVAFAGVLALVVFEVDKLGGRRTRRWLALGGRLGFVALIAGAVVVEFVRAVHVRSVLSTVDAFVVLVFAGAALRFFSAADLPSRQRRAYLVAFLLFAAWFFVVNTFHLR